MKSFPPAPSSTAPSPSHQSKKLIHFFTASQCNSKAVQHMAVKVGAGISNEIPVKTHINAIQTPCVIYFWKADTKSSSMVMLKTSHVTCVTCHMSHMSHVTNIKLKKCNFRPYVLYFWKADGKCISMVMLKTSHVRCVTCHMSQI